MEAVLEDAVLGGGGEQLAEAGAADGEVLAEVMVDEFGFVEFVGVDFTKEGVGLAGGGDVGALVVVGEGFREYDDVVVEEEAEVEVPVFEDGVVFRVEAGGGEGGAAVEEGVDAELIDDGELGEGEGAEMGVQGVGALGDEAFLEGSFFDDFGLANGAGGEGAGGAIEEGDHGFEEAGGPGVVVVEDGDEFGVGVVDGVIEGEAAHARGGGGVGEHGDASGEGGGVLIQERGDGGFGVWGDDDPLPVGIGLGEQAGEAAPKEFGTVDGAGDAGDSCGGRGHGEFDCWERGWGVAGVASVRGCGGDLHDGGTGCNLGVERGGAG